MGWTSYHATCYYKNGKINRKQECDDHFEGGLNRGYYKVLKSTMKGSTYYAAVQMMMRREKKENGEFVDIPIENGIVFAAVLLTQVDSKSYYNFSYKDTPVAVVANVSKINSIIMPTVMCVFPIFR